MKVASPFETPSETMWSTIEISGVPSSSVIVPRPWPSASVAFVGDVRLTK